MAWTITRGCMLLYLCAFLVVLYLYYSLMLLEDGTAPHASFMQRGHPITAAGGEGYNSMGARMRRESVGDISRRGRGRMRERREGILFIHVPKAAGFTWRRIFHQFGEGWVIPYDERMRDEGSLKNRSTTMMKKRGGEGESEGREEDFPDVAMSRSRQMGKVCGAYCKCIEGLTVVPFYRLELPVPCTYMLGHVDFSAAPFLQDPEGRHSVDNLFIVTNLRDPVERIVSEYHYILKMRFRHPVTLANMTLREYATSYMPAHRTTNLMTKMLAGVTHGTSYYPEDRQSEILRHGSNLLEEAKANLRDKVFFFGLKERFLDSVKLAMAQFGINKQIFVFSSHATPDGYTLPDEPLLTEIREMNHLDEDLYRYAVSLFQKRTYSFLGGVKFKEVVIMEPNDERGYNRSAVGFAIKRVALRA